MLSTILTPTRIEAIFNQAGLPVPDDADKAQELAIKLGGFRSQSEASAWLINVTEGEIDGPTLTGALRELFPNAKVSDRHGPHYLSHARTGKLKGCEYVPAKAKRSSIKKADVDALKTRIAELEALLAENGIELEA